LKTISSTRNIRNGETCITSFCFDQKGIEQDK